jgi:hypothetical protein
LALIAVGTVMSAASICGFANDSKAPGSGPNPFTDCGIGAALFPEVHWAAVTSNVIWDVGTTAVTSATASPQTCSGKRVAAAKFIVETYASVIDETARGRGQYLTAMLETMGCHEPSHAAIVSAVRPQVANAVAQEGYSALSQNQKAEQYFQILDQQISAEFAADCAA